MSNTYCIQDDVLNDEEKAVFGRHLERFELSPNIWDLFDEWISRSDSHVRFIYLKVFQDDRLIGLGLFLKIKPFDLRASYSRLRDNFLLSLLASIISNISRNCVYISLRNLITANITRPFFYQSPKLESIVMETMLDYLKKQKEADMITIVDTSKNDLYYQNSGFQKYPASSEAWFNVTQYQDISEYLKSHRSLKRNLSKRKKQIATTIQQGPVSEIDQNQIKDCLECSTKNSRVSNPCQSFFENNIFETNIFRSNKFIHIIVRVENIIAGFHTFQISGSHLGGVLGGFNRKYSNKSFAYERIIVASLEYAIQKNLKQVHYSMVDNYTKLRLLDYLEPCGLYFYSNNPVNRVIFKKTYPFNDVYGLYMLEQQGLLKYSSKKK